MRPLDTLVNKQRVHDNTDGRLSYGAVQKPEELVMCLLLEKPSVEPTEVLLRKPLLVYLLDR